jgi:beta-carotene 3-hydroxylase
MLINSIVFLLTLAAMEFWAAFVHRRLYHGVLWFVHRSHHSARKYGAFERNDLFVVFHAIAASAVVVVGMLYGIELLTAAGLGITAYGAAYFIVHDGYIHNRLPVAGLDRFAAMRRIRAAHLYHHTGDPGAHFGLFFWNRTYGRSAKSPVT